MLTQTADSLKQMNELKLLNFILFLFLIKKYNDLLICLFLNNSLFYLKNYLQLLKFFYYVYQINFFQLSFYKYLIYHQETKKMIFFVNKTFLVSFPILNWTLLAKIFMIV